MAKQIIVHGLQKVLDKLGPELVNKPLEDFFSRIGVTVQGRAREGAPVDTGHLRNSIQYEVDKSTPPLWAHVGLTSANPGSPLWLKGRAMEYGTGRQGDGDASHAGGHWPPGAALDVWARRHGGMSGWQVAAAIGKRGGLKPRRYLRDAMEQSMGDIKGFLNRLGNDILSRWDH
jgi:hypothetical protein